jgi:Na+-driven multidrug efflux pump
VFAFDGNLIGAGDTLYLAIAMFAASVFIYVPVALLALELHWGIVGVWSGLVGLIAVRGATTGVRFARRRWIVLGSTHPVRGAPRKGRAA